jgi:hypothetical protein
MEKLTKKFEGIINQDFYYLFDRNSLEKDGYDKNKKYIKIELGNIKNHCAEECKKISIEFSKWILIYYPNQYKMFKEEKGFFTLEELFDKFIEEEYK